MQILKITMASKAPDMLADFYEKILDLPVYRKAGETEIIIGSTRIAFYHAVSTQDPFYHFAINIPSNKMDEATEWVSPKVKLLWMADYDSNIADFRNWNAKSVYFFDAGGNIVELIARFDLGNERHDPFSSSQLLSVSEIGVVYRLEDIEKSTEALMVRNNLSYFSKQKPFAQFKAVGDDEGLFIIVPEGRNWYPTHDSPAARFPLQVAFALDENVHYETF